MKTARTATQAENFRSAGASARKSGRQRPQSRRDKKINSEPSSVEIQPRPNVLSTGPSTSPGVVQPMKSKYFRDSSTAL